MMKKQILLCGFAAALIGANAQVLLDDSFDYGSGVDLDGQGSWASSNSAFTVDGGELQVDGDFSSMLSTNAIQMQAGDRIVVTVDYRVHQVDGTANQSFWTAGLQADEELGEYTASSAMLGKVHYSEWDTGTIRSYPDSTSDSPYASAITTTQCGYDPRGILAVDTDTDPLQMIYTITKSGITNDFYTEITFVNTESNAPVSVAKDISVRSDLWSATNIFFSLNSGSPVAFGTEVYINNLKIEQFEPTPSAPEWVSAKPGDHETTVSWATVAGAGEYLVYRSTSDSVFTNTPVTVYGTSFTDTTVENDTTYFYAVKSQFYTGNSELSEPTSVTPSPVAIGTSIFETDFSAYSLGDLTDAADWSAIAGSGSNAFAVVSTNMAQVADTTATMSDFDEAEGNAVYLEKLVRNGQDDAVEGYIDFIVSATPSAIPEREGAAHFHHQFFMDFGLTASTSDSLKFNKSMMSLFSIKTTFEGHLEIYFENQKMLRLWRDEANWNPKHKVLDGQWASNPDADLKLYTDPLHISWKLRRTRESGQYQAFVGITNIVSGVGASKDVVEYSLGTAQELYDTDLAFFALGHSYNAKASGVAAGTDYERDSMLNVTVQGIGVTHSTNNLPTVVPPTISEVVSEDRSVTLIWDNVLDVTQGYTIFMETESGEEYTVVENHMGTTFRDVPRWNDVENYYTVRANYDEDLTPYFADSVVVTGAPKAMVKVVDINGTRNDIYSGGGTFYLNQADVVSNDVSYLDGTVTPLVAHGEVQGGVTYNGPTLYGIVQRTSTNGICSAADKYVFNSSSGHQKFMLYGGWDADSPRILAYVKVEDMTWEDGTPDRIDLSSDLLSIYYELVNYCDGAGIFRGAILNDGQWYVADTGTRLNYNGPESTKDNRYSSAMDETWNTLSIVTESSMTVGGALGDNSALTNITAVGFFCDRAPYLNLRKFEVQTGGDQSSYEFWSSDNGLGGENSEEPAEDPDFDGVDNKTEYAFGGNPMDAADVGALPEMSSVMTNGMEYLKYVYRVQRDPESGLTVDCEGTTDLVNTGMELPADAIISTETLDYYWEEITVLIPMDKEQYFIHVDVQQQ